MTQPVYGIFSNKQKQVFNDFNEKITCPVYDLIEDRTHVPFEEIQQVIPDILIHDLDIMKATKFSQPRVNQEIEQWMNKSEARFYPIFNLKRVREGSAFDNARQFVGKFGEYVNVMIDTDGGCKDWLGDLEYVKI